MHMEVSEASPSAHPFLSAVLISPCSLPQKLSLTGHAYGWGWGGGGESCCIELVKRITSTGQILSWTLFSEKGNWFEEREWKTWLHNLKQVGQAKIVRPGQYFKASLEPGLVIATLLLLLWLFLYHLWEEMWRPWPSEWSWRKSKQALKVIKG